MTSNDKASKARAGQTVAEPEPRPESGQAPERGPAQRSEQAPDPAPDPALEPGDGLDAALRADAVAQLEAEVAALRDRLLRALAECENVRRRAERDRREAEAFGGTRLARDLLAVHDNLERALGHADEAAREHAGAVIEGIELTRRELLNAFAKHRIEMFAPEKGEKFDPHFQQAMYEAPIPGAQPGTVIEVMQSGFTIAGRLLRPALVGVAKAAEPAPEPADTPSGAAQGGPGSNDAA
ncbi:MAG TPA: nucleotide exchange factor GrpE [Thermohalobaculum sp.]|nr:nucleotide exchange factor GrpE [Thermohalobaculum sp.]